MRKKEAKDLLYGRRKAGAGPQSIEPDRYEDLADLYRHALTYKDKIADEWPEFSCSAYWRDPDTINKQAPDSVSFGWSRDDELIETMLITEARRKVAPDFGEWQLTTEIEYANHSTTFGLDNETLAAHYKDITSSYLVKLLYSVEPFEEIKDEDGK